METLGTLYIVCGILYTIACIMDGQDVKPLWKKWVGKRLERAANYFFPIKYVTRYVPLPPPTPMEHYDYDITRFDSKKIESIAYINECDIMDMYIRQPYERDVFMKRLIAARKRDCLRAIFDRIAAEDIVNYNIDYKSRRPSVIVRAWLYVEKKKEDQYGKV